VCLWWPVLQAGSENQENPKELPGGGMPGQAEEGESEEMGGGESGLFPGSVQPSQGVAQEASRLSASLEEKGP